MHVFKIENLRKLINRDGFKRAKFFNCYLFAHLNTKTNGYSIVAKVKDHPMYEMAL